ncbi:TIGR03752 family integrating conjugative element protein [Vibrio kanaloae]|uniref:Putative exported protein n=1 Tax=Vibrio sp. FF_307 TaxID=1652834 RepID=A0A0H3ZQR2_9VIBR|nr:TIGR03752 family integrating conjugative element protein [Vibrio kanaloae]AKN36777.1 putative exported protein [Vibrio sp. FF_307]TKF00253.1 TIGR03752 family integrating conjugative element protein [Vibrio kanaloae]TKF17820.1 TIGR03752 family integrating conjugative element protein [Vibrio kanaloae]TKF78954.1 TIGR03752 family integrating conjugative element protein [Vibrio kanaloae]
MLNKGNPVIRLAALIGVTSFIAVLVIAVLKPSDIEATVEPAEDTTPVSVTTSQTQAQVLQAFDDSPTDTIRTLNAAYSKSEAEKKALSDALKQTQLQVENQQTQNSEQVKALETQLSQLAQRLNSSLSTIEEKVSQSRDHLKVRQAPVREVIDVSYDDLGIDSGRQGLAVGTAPGGYHPSGKGDTQDDWIWTEPLDATQDKEGKWVTPATQVVKNALSSADDAFTSQTGRFDANQQDGMPVYTLHRGTMLADAVSMTALMGRIPLNGQVTDPYPFSMILGRKNLMSSGFTLPDVQGAIVTGTVTGDWSLSCVRGVVESIDFIRADGSILSYPEELETVDSGFDGSSIKTADLGFLADPNGNPCLTGERISNAPEYLTTKGLLDAASAAANAVAISQQTISVDGSTSTSALTGNAAKNAAAESAAAFTGTVSEFIEARMGSSFDVVYTPPGTKASIHLRKPVTLRAPAIPVRVRYNTQTQGATHELP